MQINVNSDSIIQELCICSSVINGKQSIPILNDVLFITYPNEQRAEIISSDGEIWVTQHVRNVLSGEKIKFCVNAANLLSVLRNLEPNTDIVMDFDCNNNKLKISHKSGLVNMPYENGDEYPLPKVIAQRKFKILGHSLLKAIKNVSFAVSVDNLRPIISSVFFDISENKITTVGTNLKKLIKHDVDFKNETGTNASFPLPIKSANVLSSILAKGNIGDVSFGADEKTFTAVGEGFDFVCTLQSGRCPNYNSIMPKGYKFKASLNKLSFIGAIKRVNKMGDDNDDAITLRFAQGCVVVSAKDCAMCKNANEKVICDNDCNGFEIVFSFCELYSILNNIDDDTVIIYFNTEKSATVITAAKMETTAKTTSLIMPLASL